MSVTLGEARLCSNHLLAKLSDEQLQALCSMLEHSDTDIKQVIHERNGTIPYIYFPNTAAFSNLIFLEDGSAVEVGTVGNEGFTAVELLANASMATETCVCQIKGTSLRMPMSDFRNSIKNVSPLRHVAECYLQGYLVQLSQSVACNRKHPLEARFARWMLLTHDRVREQEFYLTQEYLADMLGCHRPSVSLVAAGFQKDGVLQYTRGHVKILSRAKLEAQACECYAIVRREFKRVLGVPYG